MISEFLCKKQLPVFYKTPDDREYQGEKMEQTKTILEKLNAGVYDERLEKLYVDPARIPGQRKRYSCSGRDWRKYTVCRGAVRWAETIRIISMGSFWRLR